ncbi:MAG: hypothetical protein ABIP39_04965, partial [Polyangiaceae bacterium]
MLGDRGGGAPVDTGAHAAELDVVEKARLEHERDRAAYIALAPAVSPAASGSSGVPFWRTCPPHYGVAEGDAGVFYCGKICGYGMAPLGTLVS